MSELLAKTDLVRLVDRWLSEGRRVAGPRCLRAPAAAGRPI